MPLPLTNGAVIVDNSMLELLMTCPRKLYYQLILRRIPVEEKVALTFGSAIHLGLELRHLLAGVDDVDPVTKSIMDSELVKFFDEHQVPEDEYRNLNWANEVIRRYLQKYNREEFHMMEFKEPHTCKRCEGKGLDVFLQPCVYCSGAGKVKSMVELSFALPLTTINGIVVIYAGKVDLPVILLDGNGEEQIWVLDHKTTSQLGPTFFDDKKMSPQQKGYAWAFEKLTGIKAHGFIVNAIRVKQPPLYVLNNTESKRGGKKQTPEEWWNESLVRERCILRPGELDEWKENCIELIEELFWRAEKEKFSMKQMWCVGKYGRCTYLDVCATFPKEDRLLHLQTGNFKDNTWSPLNKATQQ